MNQQAGLFFYKFHLLFAGIFAIAFLILISALVTAVGSHSVLDSRTNTPVYTVGADSADSPDAVTADTYWLINGTRHVMLTTGRALYGGCRSITTIATQTGRAITHDSAAAMHSTWSGTFFVIRGISDTVMFAVRLPHTLIRPLTSGHTVSSIIQPTDDKTVPIISNETSAAALARFNAKEQQEIASLQAAQLVANRGLDGSVVAGDPDHGGYPSKWDAPIPQDSRLDSWGMYNRECVSYAAWKVYQTFGHMPYWGGVGNANQWVGDARDAGIPTGSTPHVHSVAISMRGYYGHAMWVEAVSGNMIYVSQYNYDLHGHYSEMWVNGSYFTYIYFK